MSRIPSVPLGEEKPDHFILGENKAEIKISSAEENRNLALSMVKQARYGINIFTQDMDDAVFNNDEFENHVFNLATRHPDTKVRILVQDSTPAIKKGHRLIRIAQKLTSSVFIKNPEEIYKNDKSAFITIDGIGMLHRPRADSYNYEALVSFMSPRRVEKLDEYFYKIWAQSIRDQKVRRLCI